MVSVGVDVSKGKSMVCFMRPYGEVLISPYNVQHCEKDLLQLVEQIHGLDDEARVVMESTGAYHYPILTFLKQHGIFVSVVYESRYPPTSANTKDIEGFASKIKLYVTENNKTGLADLISYPIKVNINGSKESISNKEEFEQKYDDIMKAEFKEKIKNCYTKYLFSNYMGIMLGNGEIWFGNLNNNGLRVYAINN